MRTAELYKRSLFSLIVFTGANAPTTIDRFPRGEAVHYRERALEEGVPDEAIRVEPKARNTGENMTLTRELLAAEGITPKSVMLISRPYQERRAYATCRKLWPEVDARPNRFPWPTRHCALGVRLAPVPARAGRPEAGQVLRRE